jgi:type II secretory pathway component GspD/PulD (secretin)
LQQAFQQGGGGRGGGGGGQSPFRQQGNDEGPERRTLEERTEDLLDIIRAQVDPEGWDAGVGTIQTLGGLLIINNTPANHRAINGLLGKLRETRAMQINVETRFLLVSQDFFEQIGFDLDVYLGANNNTVRAARGTRPTTRASDFFDFRSGGFRDTFPQPPSAGANVNRSALGDPWSPVGIAQNSLGLGESLLQTDFSQDIFANAPALGIAGQFLDDIQVDFLIKATQADRRTVSLTAPRLTFTNGQISNITVGTQVQFVADLEPVVSESAVGFDPDPQPINEGVTLKVDGTISADRRYVTMNIDTGVSRIESIQPLAVSAIAGGQLVNSAATQSFIQLPTVTVTRVQTTVTVPDQGTILIGGQRLTTDAEVETGVPVRVEDWSVAIICSTPARAAHLARIWPSVSRPDAA